MQSGNGFAFSLPGSPELLPGRRLLSEASWKNMTEDSTEFAGKTVANNDLGLVHATKNGDVSAFDEIARLGFGPTDKAKKKEIRMLELLRCGITGLTVMLGIALCLDLRR
jgi:hypothetical protein